MKKESCLVYSQLCERGIQNYGLAPAYDGAGVEELVFSLDAYKSYYVLEHGASVKDYEDYCDKLLKNGFSLYSSKSSNGNSFATYTDGENIVNVSHISYKDVDRYVVRDISYMSIAVDSTKNSALPPKGENFEEITTLQVSMIDGFVIRLTDGRFLVIDSGLNREHIIEAIYGELCRQNVREGKPVVAAWMFSHAHCDHVDAFIEILKRYGDKIEVQTVIHGFPAHDTYSGKNYMEYYMDKESEAMTARSNEIKRLMDETMPEGRFVIAHTGQIFEYPGVRLEIVFTAENLYRQQMFDTNASSVVYMLTMAGGKMLALGDAVDIASKAIRRIHGKELSCDLVVLAHHAYNGGDEEMYHNTGAKVAIWPNLLEDIEEKGLVGDLANHFDVYSVKHNLIMSRNEPVMTLREGMTESELAPFARKLEANRWDAVDYDARQNPKNFITEAQLEAGLGIAPRYYGKGEETETLEINDADKTYTITLDGVTEYNFDYYCNTLKRDGYQRKDKREEDGKTSVIYACPRNSVYVDFIPTDARIVIKVGPAGVNTLEY
ncbi:MAG: hypothetical protein J6A83_00205 [Clostridia bacterium]|nr:hypothetical protein [Clostridia bacterium]